MIELLSVSKIYSGGDIYVKAVDEVSFQATKGEIVVMLGKSGSGKSTLLHVMGGIENPSAGTVFINGEELSIMDNESLTIFRRRNIGFVFQNFNLVPSLSILENILLPLKLDRKEINKELLEELVQTLDLEKKMYQTPKTLSGGQQQRVAIARALIAQPAIVLADEPTGNLDSQTSSTIIKLMQKMVKRYGQTMIIATHDMKVSEIADRIIRIEDGKIL